MKDIAVIVGLALLIIGYFLLHNYHAGEGRENVRTAQTAPVLQTRSTSTMKLESSAFANGEPIPTEFTCDGSGTNPPLSFVNVPTEAKSLALIMEDPDVPKDLKPDGMWDHWVIYNISPKVSGVESGSTITGAAYGANGSGKNEYQGPCPPDREHRYFFRLYALDTQLALKSGATKQEVLEDIQGHVIAEAELMGTYERKK